MSDNKEISTEVDNLEGDFKHIQKVLQNRKDDYEYGRELLYYAAERLQDVVEPAIQLAQESEHPRAIEVATNSITSLSDIAGRLMKHQMDAKALNEIEDKKASGINKTTNNLNVNMKASDLLELFTKDN